MPSLPVTPVPSAVMVVPAVIPTPEIVMLGASMPAVTDVTVSVVVAMVPVKTAVVTI